MITEILIALPIFAAVLVFALRGAAAKTVALVASLAELAVAIVALAGFHNAGGTQYFVNRAWIPSFGVSFKAGMDGISLLLVLLTSVLVPLIILTTRKGQFNNAGLFYALVLFMQAGLVGVFTALDGFLFYVFWELVLVPIYFICLLWGGADRIRVTIKFFIYTLAGSLLMLVALIYLYFQTPGNHTFDLQVLSSLHLDAHTQGFLFWAFFLAFAIKMPLFPFHTWQPDTYTEAPAAGSMLLSALMSKMGVYALLRILLPLAPLGFGQYGVTAAILAVIGIVYASLIALKQNDWKRLVAYSSIAHIGLIAAGIFTFTVQGMQGAVIQMLSHGVNVVGLFFIIDMIEQRVKTRQIDQLGGIRLAAPVMAGYLLVITLGSIALPFTNGFIGEFLLLTGVFQYNAWMAAMAGLGIIFGAWYMLSAYQKSILGEQNSITAIFADVTMQERLVLIPIVLMIFFVGIYPKPLLDISAPAVENIMKMVVGAR